MPVDFCQALVYYTNVRKKNPLAVALGELRAQKRFAGMTPEQISEEMRKVSLARFKKIPSILGVDKSSA